MCSFGWYLIKNILFRDNLAKRTVVDDMSLILL